MHFQIRIKRLLNSLLDLLGHMVHSLGSSSHLFAAYFLKNLLFAYKHSMVHIFLDFIKLSLHWP